MKTLLLLTALLSAVPYEVQLQRAKAELARLQAGSGMHLPLTGDDYWPEDKKPTLSPPVPRTPVHQVPEGPAASQTTVCACQGYRESVCLCRKAGMTCHCSRTSGSVWERQTADSAWVKTSRKADPRQSVAVKSPDSPNGGAAVSRPTDGTPYLATDGRYWFHDGRQWWNLSVKPVDGRQYGSFVFRGGKMVPAMAVQLPQRTGRYVCRGGYCEWVWD